MKPGNRPTCKGRKWCQILQKLYFWQIRKRCLVLKPLLVAREEVFLVGANYQLHRSLGLGKSGPTHHGDFATQNYYLLLFPVKILIAY